jgi:predicted CoA-substrate-specific enzyme activase
VGRKSSLEEFWAGVDVGAATTKAVVIDGSKAIRGFHVQRSGVDYDAGSREAFRLALHAGEIVREHVRGIVSTGYGRHNVSFTDLAKTEIGCHMKGCFHHYPHAATIVDIGGQDCKVIHVDEGGRRSGFKMNRKCAAGTGAFLEEIALRLGLDVAELDPLARRATTQVRIGAYCTVFTSTEILALIRKGEKVEDIARGVFESVIQRILEMDPLSGAVLLTGGVIQHNAILADILRERLGRAVMIPPHPQIMGAFGAALYALEGTGARSRVGREKEASDVA